MRLFRRAVLAANRCDIADAAIFLLFMSGRTAWITRKVPLAFTSITASHACSGKVSTSDAMRMPALLTTASTMPKSLMMLPIMVSTSAFDETSAK